MYGISKSHYTSTTLSLWDKCTNFKRKAYSRSCIKCVKIPKERGEQHTVGSIPHCHSYWFTITMTLSKAWHGTQYQTYCNNPIFQTLNWELTSITLLITEFYCICFTDLIITISRMVLYYLTRIIIFQFKYEIVNILINYLKLFIDVKTWD